MSARSRLLDREARLVRELEGVRAALLEDQARTAATARAREHAKRLKAQALRAEAERIVESVADAASRYYGTPISAKAVLGTSRVSRVAAARSAAYHIALERIDGWAVASALGRSRLAHYSGRELTLDERAIVSLVRRPRVYIQESEARTCAT